MHVPVVQLHAYTLATTKIAEENLVRVSDTKDLLPYLAAKRKKKKFRYDNAEVQLVQRPLDDLEKMNERIRLKHKIICARLKHVCTPLKMIWQLPFGN